MMADDNFSCIKEVTKVVYLTILPIYSSNAIGAVCEIIESWKSHYIQQLQGIVVGYKNVSLVSKRGYIKVDNPVIYCAVKATFDLFYPSVGNFVKAQINRVSDDSVGCLIHNTINVAINRKLYVVNEASEFIALDRFILFEITRINLKRKFIHLKGQITDECVKLMKENDIFKRDVVTFHNNEPTEFSSNSFNDATSISSVQSSNELANADENSQNKPKKAKKRKRESLDVDSPHKKKRITTESDSDKSKDKSPQKEKKSKKDSNKNTGECVSLVGNGVLKNEVDDSENYELPKFPNDFIIPSKFENHLDNEIVNTDIKSLDNTKKVNKKKGDSLGVDSPHKKKRKTTESDSDKSKDKSPKKEKKSKKDSHKNTVECVSLVGNGVLKNEVDDSVNNELPEFPSDLIIPSKFENLLDNEIVNTDIKSPVITKKVKKKKGDSLGVDNVPKKKGKSKENNSDKSKNKSPKKKKKEKSKKDIKEVSDKCLDLINQHHITIKSEANDFELNGLPEFSIPADLHNHLGDKIAQIDLKPPDILKKAKKRKRESLDNDNSPKKKRKINENDSVKTKEKSLKKKKKDKSKKDSKKTHKKDKKKKPKVLSTKKRLHGYKVKLKKKDKDKNKDKKSKKKKSKSNKE